MLTVVWLNEGQGEKRCKRDNCLLEHGASIGFGATVGNDWSLHQAEQLVQPFIRAHRSGPKWDYRIIRNNADVKRSTFQPKVVSGDITPTGKMTFFCFLNQWQWNWTCIISSLRCIIKNDMEYSFKAAQWRTISSIWILWRVPAEWLCYQVKTSGSESCHWRNKVTRWRLALEMMLTSHPGG